MPVALPHYDLEAGKLAKATKGNAGKLLYPSLLSHINDWRQDIKAWILFPPHLLLTTTPFFPLFSKSTR